MSTSKMVRSGLVYATVKDHRDIRPDPGASDPMLPCYVCGEPTRGGLNFDRVWYDEEGSDYQPGELLSLLPVHIRCLHDPIVR